MSSAVVQAFFGSYDLRNAKQWRDEDLAYRDQEIQWLNDDIVRTQQWRNADVERSIRKQKLHSEHRLADARAEQLATISEQCALLCGFTVASMSNLGIPDQLHELILLFYALVSGTVCVTLLMCMIITTLLLLAVTRYAAHTLEDDLKNLDVVQVEMESPFGTWWLKKCESELRGVFKLLHIGLGLFFVFLGLLSWIQFIDSTATASSISILAFVGLLFWQLRVASRWRYLLLPPSPPTFSYDHGVYSAMPTVNQSSIENTQDLAAKKSSPTSYLGFSDSNQRRNLSMSIS